MRPSWVEIWLMDFIISVPNLSCCWPPARLLSLCPRPAARERTFRRAVIVFMLKRGPSREWWTGAFPGFTARCSQSPKRNGNFVWSSICDIKLPPKEGAVPHGNTCKSAILHSERRLGNLCEFDRRLSARSNPPIFEEVSLLLLSRQSVPVLGPAVPIVSKPKSLNLCGGCDDGPCLISGLTGSPLSRWLGPEEPSAGQPQDSDVSTSFRVWCKNYLFAVPQMPQRPNASATVPLFYRGPLLYRHKLANSAGAQCSSKINIKKCFGSNVAMDYNSLICSSRAAISKHKEDRRNI